MENEQYHSASHCKYLTQYHIVWCPKFRYSVLENGVDITLKQILSDICNKSTPFSKTEYLNLGHHTI